MRENEELAHAWDFIENTNTSIFLTGKAGTGKTTFLRTLKEHSNKRIVVLAPTGVAAMLSMHKALLFIRSFSFLSHPLYLK